MKNNSKSNRSVLASRGILLAVTIVFMLFFIDVFSISLHLFFISDDIHFMEESGRWTDEDHEYYDVLIQERNDIEDNSVVGFLLVQAGSNVVFQLIRMIILIGLFIAFIFVLALWGSIIRSDLRFLKRKITKRIAKKH